MISVIMELCANLFDAIIAVYFLTKFNNAHFRKNYFAVPAFALIFGFSLISDKILPGFDIFPMIALFVFTASYALFICKKHYVRAIISACIYEMTFMLCSSFLYSILSILTKDFELLMQDSSSMSRYVYLVLHKIALLAILELFLVLFQKSNRSILSNGLLTFLFTFVTSLGLAATMALTVLPEVRTMQLQILLIVFSFIAANALLYILLWQVQKLQQPKHELALLEKKMELQEAHYKEIADVYANARQVQHDITKHLSVISYYLKENNLTDSKKYLQEVLSEVENTQLVFHSGNTILDCLLQAKMNALKNIQLKIAGYAGDFSDIKEADLTCLIGNILDNAIEGVAEVSEKRIELFFNQKDNTRIIICQNTVNHSVLATNPSLQSTKPLKGEHGLGHKIIAKIVAKYNGMLEYYEEDGMFGVQIFLPMPSSK